MKKVLFCLFILFLFISNPNASTKFYIGEKIPSMHLKSDIRDSKLINNLYVLRNVDSNLVYCLDPFILINTKDNYEEYLYNDSKFNIDDIFEGKYNIPIYVLINIIWCFCNTCVVTYTIKIFVIICN